MLASIRILVLLLAILAFAPAARAQQHDARENTRCRFARFPYTNPEGGVVCYACVADRDKEHQAKVAANKQRLAAKDTENAANRNAEQAAFKKKQQQEDQQATARQRSAEVLINGNASKFDLTARRPAAKNVASGTILAYGNSSSGRDGASFENENREEVILNRDWDLADAITRISLTQSASMPRTWGQILYRLGRGTRGVKHEFIDACSQRKYYGGWDLVNAKGTTLFNNKYITSILHIKDGWFMLSIDSSEVRNRYKHCDRLYNIYTKKIIPLPRKFDMGGWISDDCGGSEQDKYQAYDHFIPIFGNTTTLSQGFAVSYPYNIIISYSKTVKEKTIEYAPQLVNEAVLNTYSFAIICTEGISADFDHYRSLETFFGKYPYRKLMLITKEGKVVYKDLP